MPPSPAAIVNWHNNRQTESSIFAPIVVILYRPGRQLKEIKDNITIEKKRAMNEWSKRYYDGNITDDEDECFQFEEKTQDRRHILISKHYFYYSLILCRINFQIQYVKCNPFGQGKRQQLLRHWARFIMSINQKQNKTIVFIALTPIQSVVAVQPLTFSALQ